MGDCRGGDGPCTDCGECGHSKYDKPDDFMPAAQGPDAIPTKPTGLTPSERLKRIKLTQRRIELRDALDELFGDYMRNEQNAKPSQVSVLDLLSWASGGRST